jgi:hypothetical protein
LIHPPFGGQRVLAGSAEWLTIRVVSSRRRIVYSRPNVGIFPTPLPEVLESCMRSARSFLKTVLVALATATLAACGGGGGGSAPAEQQGTLRVSLTDAPSCGYSNVFITVEKVRVHRSASANDNAAGWSEIVLSPAKRVDLLTLINGAFEGLGQMPLTAGQYQQVRLVLAENGGGTPANALRLQPNGADIALDTPSATQSGLKLNRPFTVEANRVSDLILDFKVCDSIVRRGNGTYALKPVIQILEAVNVAAIAGNVAAAHVPNTGTGQEGVLVTAQKNGVVERATTPNAVGEFILAYLDPAKSPYDIVFTQPAFATAVVAAVPATTSAITRVSTSGQPIALGASVMRTASGTLGPAGARDSAVVRALQAVGGVPAVQVGPVANVAPDTGAYSLSLPAAAPTLASFSTTLPLSFSAVAPSAGQYTLNAKAAGFVEQNIPGVNLSASSVVQNITLVPTP